MSYFSWLSSISFPNDIEFKPVTFYTSSAVKALTIGLPFSSFFIYSLSNTSLRLFELNPDLSNVVVKKDAGGNQGPDKAKAKNRIDGAVSLLDAYAVLINHYEDYCNYQGI